MKSLLIVKKIRIIICDVSNKENVTEKLKKIRKKKAVRHMDDEFYYDEGFPFDIELYNDLESVLATDSNSGSISGSSGAISVDFQVFLVLALGVLQEF